MVANELHLRLSDLKPRIDCTVLECSAPLTNSACAATLQRVLPIVYQDEHLLAIDKPSGLLSVPGRGPELQDCALSRLAEHFPAIRCIHRLDRDTSGILLFALNLESQREIGRQMESRRVAKRYEAVVAGSVREQEGLIDLPLAKDFSSPPRHRVDEVHGRASQTRYYVVSRQTDATRLELVPLTGRSHQLRVHLASLGHPILGDPLYAPDDVQRRASRLMLHARELVVAHPVSREVLRLSAACPF